MVKSPNITEMIEKYFVATSDAITTLYQKSLFGHLLVVIYSTIDTLGFLDAPADQESASGESFKNWVKKYLLQYPGIEFDETDLWSARCAVLHTFTTQSRLSRSGNARELQYYGGDKSTKLVADFVAEIKKLEDGKHLPVNFDDLCMALLEALKGFVYDLDSKCVSDPKYEKRMRNILQIFHNP